LTHFDNEYLKNYCGYNAVAIGLFQILQSQVFHEMFNDIQLNNIGQMVHIKQ